MLIGDKTCFLRIEAEDFPGSYTPFRIEAGLVLDDKAEFRGMTDWASFSTSEDDRRGLAEFAEARAPGWRVAITEGGSLELRRDVHGNIDVLFSFGYLRIGPHWKLAGDVQVAGEFTQQFLRDLEALLFSR